jgi:hypothetical protein
MEQGEKATEKALEKTINARDGKYQQESKALLEKLSKGIEDALRRSPMLTPQVFAGFIENMIPHLDLPADKVEVLRRMANQVILVVNDTKAEKAIHNNRLMYGLTQLTHAKALPQLEYKLKAVKDGIRAIENALPDIHAMVQYQAHEALAKLQQEKASIHSQLNEPERATSAEKLAAYHQALARLSAENSHFTAGFLEGLLIHQSQQFPPKQQIALQGLLNAVAADVRPLSLVIQPYEDYAEKFARRITQEFYVKQEEEAGYDVPVLVTYYYRRRTPEEKQEARDKVKRWKMMWQTQPVPPEPPNYSAYHKASVEFLVNPSAYAEDLPRRAKLRELGVQFEPYPDTSNEIKFG